MDLNRINFSEGIREEEIKKCFSDLDEELSKERINIGGSGIVNGLNLELYNFKLKVSSGEVIDKNGKLIRIEQTNFDISKPDIFKYKEEKNITTNGEIKLSYVPYNINQDRAAQYEPNIYERGIYIKSLYNNDRVIDCIDIRDKVLIVDAEKYGSEQVTVDYYYSLPRYDTIYITHDDNNKAVVKIAKGTPSFSPDIFVPNDYDFLIGTIKIDPYTRFSNATVKAYVTIQQIFKQHRNISTDKNNNLLFCGENYRNLKFINTTQPAEPKDKTFWYDKDNNVIKVWNEEKENGYWKTLNDVSSTTVTESKIWNAKEIRRQVADLKTFKFDKNDLNLRFTPGTNSLTVIIDNKVLMSDQFDEVIDYTSIEDKAGIGFKLGSEIDLNDDTCVEVRVTHQINSLPNQVFQRAAAFSEVRDIRINLDNECTFSTDNCYLTDNYQLEVYLNGLRLKQSDFIEGTDLDIKDKSNKKSNQFRITVPTKVNDVVTYKITTNIYSYNTLQAMLGNAQKDLEKLIQKLKKDLEVQTKTLNDFMQNTNQSLLTIKGGKAHE